MGSAATRSVVAGALAALAVGGCAGTRIEQGVFRSEKGYRVPLPASGWTVSQDDRVDLTLRHRDGRHAMLVNASCDAERQRGPLAVLARHLLSGLRERSVVTREDVSVNGKTARHALVDGRSGDDGPPLRVELYVMRDDRCLYDFLYVAPRDAFDAERAAFERLVREFRTGD